MNDIKTILFIIIIALLISSHQTQAQYGGGTGDPNEPYLIYDPNQMNSIGVNTSDWDKHFKLMADIDLSQFTGNQYNVIGDTFHNPFTGTFDGNHHTISNLTYIHPAIHYHGIGLFGNVKANNNSEYTIKNLELLNPSIEGYNLSAPLVGHLISGHIINCHSVSGNINSNGNFGDSIGGLIGKVDSSCTIKSCSNSSNVTGGKKVGGLVGLNHGLIENCTSSGIITGTNLSVGNLVGSNQNTGRIINCSTSGTVSGVHTSGGLTGGNLGVIRMCHSTSIINATSFSSGGISGSNSGTIIKSYCNSNISGTHSCGGFVGNNSGLISEAFSLGQVNGDTNIGGFVGDNSGEINNSYSKCTTIGNSSTGGLVGRAFGGIIINCYSSGIVTGISSTGGLIGSATRSHGTYSSFWDTDTTGIFVSSGGIGKTTNELKQTSTFSSWGCPDHIWTINENIDTPNLSWENNSGVIISNCPQFASGNGDPNNPFFIETTEQYIFFSQTPAYWNKHFKLQENLDLYFFSNNINTVGLPLKPFSGNFNGNGNTLSNLHINSPSKNHVGLFGYIHNADPNHIIIEHLTLDDPNIVGNNHAGCLVGEIGQGTITNCNIENGFIHGHDNYTGGLVGKSKGNILHSYFNGTVFGNYATGGLAGRNYESGRIQNSYSSGMVSGGFSVGGLVGTNEDANITYCKSTSDTHSTSENMGGLIGANFRGIITHCYSSGIVNGNANHYGGLIGINDNSIITNCYSISAVTGNSKIGGLIGYLDEYSEANFNTVIQNCYSSGQVIGNIEYGGLIGYSQTTNKTIFSSYWDIDQSGVNISQGGEGKTNLEMTTESTFDTWGCLESWTIDASISLPKLLWENQIGNLITNCPLETNGGNGSIESPYLIANASQLNSIGKAHPLWDKHYQLINNIDLSSIIHDDFNLIGEINIPFSGLFNGNNFSISNFSFSTNLHNHVGLFKIIKSKYFNTVKVKDLDIINPIVNGHNNVGSLIGELANGTIQNCRVFGGNISGSGSRLGGLIGSNSGKIIHCSNTSNVGDLIFSNTSIGGIAGNNSGEISECKNSGEIEGYAYIGGITGSNYSSINNSINTGDISGTSSVGGINGQNHEIINNCHNSGIINGVNYSTFTSSTVGGLVGMNRYGEIMLCINNGNVFGNTYVGGFAGVNWGTIKNSGNNGNITGGSNTGGFAASNTRTIKQCYNTGNVTGESSTGGFVATNTNTIEQSYNSGNVIGVDNVGGLVGINTSDILECFSKCTISGNIILGGLVGDNNNGTIKNSYVISTITGDSQIGGIAGKNNNNYNYLNNFSATVVHSSGFFIGGLTGIGSHGNSTSTNFYDNEIDTFFGSSGGGKTTAEMQSINTFINAGWDFKGTNINGTEDIWDICEGTNYPRLSWEILDGDISCPYGVNIMDISTLADVWLLQSLKYDSHPIQGNGFVNMADFASITDGDENSFNQFKNEWLQSGTPLPDFAPVGGDGIFNMLDFAVLSDNWLQE